MPRVLPSSPTELGFIDKFASWRNNQAETVEASLFNTKRVTVNCATTGFGKTLAYMTEALLAPGRACIIAPTKGHQDQLMKDFSNIGLVDIRGKDNYECSARAGWTCKDGHTGGCLAKGTDQCPRTKAYQKFLKAKIGVTSYKYWVAEHKYGTGLGPFSLVIFDEADNCPDELADSVQVSISANEVENILERSFPLHGSTGADWKVWAGEMSTVAKSACLRKKAQIESSKTPKPSWIKEFHHLKNMVQKLSTVALIRPAEWVWEQFDWGWQFDPIKFHRYTESRLFLKIPKISMYSATIRPKTLHMLGIGDDDVLFIQHPSVFDPHRSPIYSVPSMRVDTRNKDLSVLCMRIDQIGTPRVNMGRNGIIHVTSFDYRDEIIKKCVFRPSIVFQQKGLPAAVAVERFKQQGGVLISPSISSGYDFPDDECRFNIMTKIPWQPKTKVIKAREEVDPLYGPYNAVRTLVQQSGRGDRSETDWCENFILDNHFEDWFYNRYSFLMTPSFRERVRFGQGIPPVAQWGKKVVGGAGY